MWRELIVLSGALISLAGIELSQQEKAGVSGEDVIAARQESMDMSAIATGSMREAMKAGREAKAEAYPAAALAKWAKVLPKTFPAGTGAGESSADSQALSAIWRDRAGFDQATSDFADATARLSALAVANDTAAFTKQLDEVKRACNSCHGRYKAGAQGPPAK